jgi:energy-coupling factor transporter ATP-binding protein EcfA2
MSPRKKRAARKKPQPKAPTSKHHLKLALAGLFLVGFLLLGLVILSSVQQPPQQPEVAPPVVQAPNLEQLVQDVQVELESAMLRSGASLKQLKVSQAGDARRLEVDGIYPERQILVELSRRLHRLAPDLELLLAPNDNRLIVQKGSKLLFTLQFAPVRAHPPQVVAVKPRIAIIMDDLGRDIHLAQQAIALDQQLGQLDPRNGELDLHPQARLAYFAQHAAETLNGKLTVLQAVEEVAPFDTPTSALRGLLGNFLFVADDVFKSCRVLSGGERQRVALARMLLQPANLLLLDEPTHHLDLAGKEVLEGALQQYPGAVIVVTHDRSLMASLATRIVAVEEGRVVLFPGGYDDYEGARVARAETAKRQTGSGRAAPESTAAPAASNAARSTKGGAATTTAKGTESRPRSLKNEAKRLAREREQVESDLERRDAELKEVEAALADPSAYADASRTKELLERYEGLRRDVDGLWRRLEELDRV